MKFYVDTSVWGGIGDEEFAEWTLPFFEQARKGLFTLVISDVTIDELENSPERIRRLPYTIPNQFIERVYITPEQLTLDNRYISEGALVAKHLFDARHIAIASILKVDSLVSWNFKHMVNFFRIKQYNSINLKYGYSVIDINTPKEFIYGKKD